MNWATPIQYLRDHLKTLKWFLYAVMAAAIVFDILIPHREAFFWGDEWPVFWSIFGLGCCVLLILIMKGLSHKVLMKKEDYYG